MEFTEYQDLLPSEILETVQNIHAELSAMGFTEEIKEAKSGPVLSYMKDRKVLLNYVYRKSGIKVRLYAGGIAAYEDCLAVLPDSMKAEFKKQPTVKTERADLHAHLPRRIWRPILTNLRCENRS